MLTVKSHVHSFLTVVFFVRSSPAKETADSKTVEAEEDKGGEKEKPKMEEEQEKKPEEEDKAEKDAKEEEGQAEEEGGGGDWWGWGASAVSSITEKATKAGTAAVSAAKEKVRISLFWRVKSQYEC